VQAQSEPWPLSRGKVVVTLTVTGDRTHRCTVEDIKGTFVRCGPVEREPFSIGQRERPEEWVNLAQVIWVTRSRQSR